MANKPTFYSPKLSKAENNAVNGMIKRSWLNGRRSGAKNAYRYLFSKNKKKGGSS